MSHDETPATGYEIVHMDHIEPVRCSCGLARRAFGKSEQDRASFHVVDIGLDARPHYHRDHTEIYYILDTEGEASLELNGCAVPVWPGSAVMIHPGTRHRAVGRMKIINVAIPPYDPADEWFD